MRSFLVLSLLAVSCGGGGSEPLTSDEVASEVDAIAGELVSSGKVIGLSVAVLKGARTIVSSGWGAVDRVTAKPASAATPYRILSISKQVTAVALLRLVEEGRVSLDEPVATFFPTLGVAGTQIRVRHLLSHTAGLPELWDMPGWEAALTTTELAALYDGRPTSTFPGNTFAYRNVNYVFAGLIVEQITGEVLPVHLRRTLFTPLGMTGTGFCDASLETHGYVRQGGVVLDAPLLELAANEGSASLCSTVVDLAIWQRAFDERQLLDETLTTLARTPTRLSTSTVQYGLGVDLSLGGTRQTVGHGGAGDGWIATLVHDVEADVTIIILANTSDATVNVARTKITAAALALP